MRTAILLHGKPDKDEYYSGEYPSASNSHWFPWLQKQLLIREIAAHTPEIPHCYNPDYSVWRKEFERFDITSETFLVGHSCGGGFIVRWLSEHPEVTVGKVILVAPWLDPNRDDTTDFFDFEIDSNLAMRTKRITIFNSDDDYASVQETVKILRNKLQNIHYREFHNHGHFCHKDLGTEAFPELLEELV
ncbi:MAG TPA: alpha/beta hydrolase [Candidatus Saccharimonadales bacterium]|nr:alpha/beta hydrolase [Candidatus Saccharimonadales bacterium]